MPSWVRFPDMRAGTQLGLRTPVQSALSLILGSLLKTYGAAKGAKVLIRGGMLKNHVLQRLRHRQPQVRRRGEPRGGALQSIPRVVHRDRLSLTLVWRLSC